MSPSPLSASRLSRRKLLLTGAAATLVPATARAQAATDGPPPLIPAPEQAPVRRNTSSFVRQDWRDHFDTLGVAAIVCDTASRALHYWSGDESDYRIYPTSVPASEELTKRGYTEVVRKKVGPDWTPTASMKERNPELQYMPPGPDNPLGTHAMYLSWPAYLIHGTHDTRKIGRQSSDGCIGLYNPSIEELFAATPIGTQVRII
ncbi:L,D-transpeptidase [Pseudooceanicola marinus]|uniref:L,D-transpeptidase n=1 Tax=Pseudooceanicola marinus TaxID=396013 RepID=UPI001CD6D8A0|nr:L,D-transpeptidase [Pseudooceanicola marinus]MCA1336691.1 L,D-transpeptidase [Pseudooceanicola marinus]